MSSASAVPRVVIDTNVLVSALLSGRAAPALLLQLWHQGRFLLVTSSAQRAELERALTRPRLARYGMTDEVAQTLLGAIDELGERVEPQEALPLRSRDPKDDMLLASALGGGANYLVTGDDDLLVLREDPRVLPLRIVTARELVEALRPPG